MIKNQGFGDNSLSVEGFLKSNKSVAVHRLDLCVGKKLLINRKKLSENNRSINYFKK